VVRFFVFPAEIIPACPAYNLQRKEPAYDKKTNLHIPQRQSGQTAIRFASSIATHAEKQKKYYMQ
jgi:hypothetical protein